MTSHSGPGKTWAVDSANSTADPDFPQAWQEDMGLFVPPEAASFIAPGSQVVNPTSSNQAALADQGSPMPPLPPTPPGLPFPPPGVLPFVYASQVAGAVEQLGLDAGLTALYLKQLPNASQTSAFWALYENFTNLSPDGRSVAVEIVAKDGDNTSLLQELQALGLQDGGSTASGVRGWLPTDQLGALVGLSDFDQAHVVFETAPSDNPDYPWQLLSDDAEQIIEQTVDRGLDVRLAALYLEHSSYAAETEPFWSTTSQNYVSADGTEVAILAYARDGNGATLLQELESIGLQGSFDVPGGGVGGELPIDQVDALLGLSDFSRAWEAPQPVMPTYADGSPIRPSSDFYMTSLPANIGPTKTLADFSQDEINAAFDLVKQMGSDQLKGLDGSLAALYLEFSPQYAKQTEAYWSTQSQYASAFSADGKYVVIDAYSNDGNGTELLKELQSIGLQDGASYQGGAGGYLPVDQVGALVNLSDYHMAMESGMVLNASVTPLLGGQLTFSAAVSNNTHF